MHLRKTVRPLVTAAVLGVAVLSSTAAHVHAYDNQSSCERRGGLWVPGAGCADKTCQYGAGTFQPGETRVYGFATGHLAVYMCDGFTGEWVLVGRTQPTETSPVAPEPSGVAPSSDAAPSSPQPPRPGGIAPRR
jgi:hypothetical protein